MNCKICDKEFKSFKELTTHLIKEHSLNAEKLYEYFNYSFELGEGICPICGNNFKLSWRQKDRHKKGLSKGIGCTAKCSRELLELLYGNPSTWDSVKEKKKQTNLKNWGVENVFQAKAIKDKAKETNLEKYGVEYAMQSNSIKDKSKKVNLEKYGVEHVSQREDIKNRKKKKSLEKYGVENVSQAEEIKDKKKKSALERYGVNYTLQAPEVRNKIKETNLEKYGVECTLQAQEIKDKAKKTNLKRYGTEYVSQSKEIRDKIKETNLEKYSVEWAISSPDVIDKSKQTNLEKYGVSYFCQHERCIQAGGNRISNLNKKFQKFLNNNGIESKLEFIIENSGYDLKVGNTLIEVNPCYTHNITKAPYIRGKQVGKIPLSYHAEKTKFAKEHGFNCIHVFDWDDWEKILYLLQDKKVIQARKCIVKEITNRKEVDEFLGKYHLQGSTKSFQYACGLYYNEELVEVMTFGKPRYNKNYEYELLRLCSKPAVKVVGGASKLLKYFEENIKLTSIISYCDLSKFNGEVYEKLGFKLKEQTQPAKHWYNLKTKRHITDNLLRQRGFDQLHNTNFGKGTSNEELMREHNYVEIMDCGQLVFVK